MAKSSGTKVPVIATTLRVQIVSAVQRSQRLTLETAQAVSKSTGSLPKPELPPIPGLRRIPSPSTAARFTFDFATELLNSQRDFALELARILENRP
jgi:hypothetical protein